MWLLLFFQLFVPNEYFAFLKISESGQRQPSDQEIRAAVWETCGDSGALQVLVDLLNVK